MLLKFFKSREVKSPVRGHPTDAGIDFYMPTINEKFYDDVFANQANSGVKINIAESTLIIPPSHNAVIPSGIRIAIPFGYMGLFLNKSGVASKKDLIIGAQVIDTYYSGEVHIDLHNISDKEIVIKEEQKLAQLVLVPILECGLIEVSELNELYNHMIMDKIRGENGFGSTDNQ